MGDTRALTMAEARRLRRDDAGALAALDEARRRRARARQKDLGAITHWLPLEDADLEDADLEDADLENADLVDPSDPATAPRSSSSPLAGFSAGLKANIAATGAPTHCGSLFLADYRSSYDATVVRRLRAAGARFEAVTAMDEFGMGSSSEFTEIGGPVNPWDPARTAGGSSGGSAAAVAAGDLYFALGSDTGGSVRQPAHCCGVVGLKPTWGRVSRYGLVAFASSLDTIGVLARGVLDAWDVLRAMAGPDPLDATSGKQPAWDGALREPESWRGVVCGVPRDLDNWAVAPEVLDHQRENEKRLSDLGATLEPLPLAGWRGALATYTVLNAAEAASNLQRFDGSLYGRRGAGAGHRESLVAGRTAGFGPEVRRRILLGCHVLSEGFQERYYLRARAARQALVREFHDLFGAVDVLAVPTAPTAAFPLGSLLEDPVAMRGSDLFTVPASLAGLPALSLPTGFQADGLPLSLQLIAPWWAERRLCALAWRLEQALPERAFPERRPRV